MREPLQYKGYFGSAEVSLEDDLIVGRLLYIRDVVSYVAERPADVEAAFREAVDDYLATCAELGDEPNVPFKGSFNIRPGPERHQSAVRAAEKAEVSLNEWICRAIDAYLTTEPVLATNYFTVPSYDHEDIRQVTTSIEAEASASSGIVVASFAHGAGATSRGASHSIRRARGSLRIVA